MSPKLWRDAAERDWSVVAVREQVIFALLDDRKLDARCDRAVNQQVTISLARSRRAGML
jgi:hypothetical protein